MCPNETLVESVDGLEKLCWSDPALELERVCRRELNKLAVRVIALDAHNLARMVYAYVTTRGGEVSSRASWRAQVV